MPGVEGRRRRQPCPQPSGDGLRVVENVTEAREDAGRPVLPDGIRAGRWRRRLRDEDAHHLPEAHRPGFPGYGAEVDEQLRTAARAEARPQRVGQGESIDQIPGTRPAVAGDTRDHARGLIPDGREAEGRERGRRCRSRAGRDDGRQPQPQRGEDQTRKLLRLFGAEEQAVQALSGAGDVCRVRHPLPREGHTAYRAGRRQPQGHGLAARL